MKRTIFISITAALFLFSGLFLPAAAQNNAGNLFQFLQTAFDRHDGDLFEYLAAELEAYGLTFADSSRAADASHLLAKVYLDKGKKHEALSCAYKTLFLYPHSTRAAECREMVQSIMLKDKSYLEKKGTMESALFGPAAGANAADRWYAYLTFLMELDESRLNERSLAETRSFAIRFPADERIYQALQWTADLYARLDQKKEAIYSYRKLEQLYPDSPRLPYALFQQAKLLTEKTGEHAEAVSRCIRIVANYPTDELAPAAAFMLGDIKEDKLKEHGGAIEAYRKLVDTWPQEPRAVEALLAIAEIHDKKLKNTDAALLTYDEVVQKYHSSPRGVEALERSGDIYADDKKDFIKAAASYAKISELYPTDEKAPQMLLKAGTLCEEKVKDYRRAIDYYQIIVDKYPDSKKSGDAKEKIAKAMTKL